MNNQKLSLLFAALTLTLLFSCKTREDIQREQMVESMSMQMQDSQQLNANFSVRLQNIEERITNVTGQVEEDQHKTKQTLDSRIQSLEERLKLIEGTQKSQTDSLSELSKDMAAQKKYINEVLSTLKGMSGKKNAKSTKKSLYWQTMGDYKKGRYQEAKQGLLTLLDQKKVSGGQKARVIHNLGMIAYMDKENDKALSYFSKLFTEFPKTGYNKNGLLFLARTFKRLNKNEEAKQTLNELISRWPKAGQVKEAKKLLGKL